MRRKRWMVACLICAMALVSCTDSSYDLTDIDSTARVEVNDFTIPVNVKEVKLDKILDIKEGDRIEKIGDDLYGVVEENTFESDVISIDPVNLAFSAQTEVNATMTVYEKIDIPNLPDIEVEVAPYVGNNVVVNYGIAEDVQNVEFTAKNIDEHVKRIDNLTVKEVTYRVSLAFKGLDNFVNTYTLEDLIITLPKGLTASVSDGGKYDSKTGRATFPKQLKSDPGLKKDIDVKITTLDMKEAGTKLENQNLTFSSKLQAQGALKVYGEDLKPKINLKKLLDTESINYTLSGAMQTALTVTKVSGAVRYDVDPINIDPIELKDLPDFLAQTGTVIDMKNPQLYLEVNNPIKQGVKPNVELSMTTNPVNSYAPFKVNMVVGDTESKYCCSPLKPADYISGWDGAEWKEFKNFGKILVAGQSGKEQIPSEINVVANAYVDQEVTDFELKNYGRVTGSYKFFAPIELTENSKIAYEDDIDGWNDEDLDKIHINTLKLEGKVSTDIPAQSCILTITPLVIKNGQTVADGQSATVELRANASGKIENCPVNCVFQKPIEHLEGIRIKANYNASGKDAFRPSQNLKVNSLKVTVGGYYEDEF